LKISISILDPRRSVTIWWQRSDVSVWNLGPLPRNWCRFAASWVHIYGSLLPRHKFYC